MDSTKRWITLAFTWNGLRALGVPEESLATFPDEFREGMAARADILGDTGANHPDNWVGGLAGDNPCPYCKRHHTEVVTETYTLGGGEHPGARRARGTRVSRCRSRRPAQGENPALRSTERNQRDQAGAIPYPVVSWAFTMVATGRIRCSCMACHRVFRSGRSGHPPRERGRGRDSSVHARKGGSSRQGRSWTARWAWRRFSHRPNGQASGGFDLGISSA